MATTLTVSSSYAGEKAAGYISAAILEGVTLGNGAIDIRQNVKYKEVMQTFNTDANLIKGGSCDFDATGTITLDERYLEPSELQVNLEFCKSKFASSWEAIELGYSAHEVAPKSFTDYLIGHVSAKVAANMETKIWQDTAASGDFDGFETILSAGSGPKVTQVAIDSSNVLEKMGDVIEAMPAALFGKDDLTLYVSQNVAKAYVRALGGFATGGLGAAGIDNQGSMWYNGQRLTFEGVDIFVCNGMSDNTMILAQAENLAFGTGLLSDYNEVKVIDLADIDGSKNVRVVMRFTAGVQIGVIEDTVYYGA